jgi:hypothetical protein
VIACCCFEFVIYLKQRALHCVNVVCKKSFMGSALELYVIVKNVAFCI